MNKTVLILIASIFSLSKGFSQRDSGTSYFEKAKQLLETDSSIADVQELETYYKNGNPKHRSLCIRYKEDSVLRYFPVGETIDYYRNGAVARVLKISPLADLGIDTTIIFNRKGKVECEAISFHLHNLSEMPMDTSVSVEVSHCFVREYILKKDYFYIETANNIGTLPVCILRPKSVLNVSYKDFTRSYLGELTTDNGLDYYQKDLGKNVKWVKISESDQVKQTLKIKKRDFDLDEATYKGDPASGLTKYLNNYLTRFNKLPLKPLRVMSFDYGYYYSNGDTTRCYIADVYKPESRHRYAIDAQLGAYEPNTWNEYLFLIAYKDGRFETLTAKDVSGYSGASWSFVSASIANEYFFMQELSKKGNVELFQRQKIFTDPNNYYLIADHAAKKVSIVAPDNQDLKMTKEIPWINISGWGTYWVVALEDEQEIRSYLCSLPNMTETLKKRIRNGFYTPDQIDIIFKKYGK